MAQSPALRQLVPNHHYQLHWRLAVPTGQCLVIGNECTVQLQI